MIMSAYASWEAALARPSAVCLPYDIDEYVMPLLLDAVPRIRPRDLGGYGYAALWERTLNKFEPYFQTDWYPNQRADMLACCAMWTARLDGVLAVPELVKRWSEAHTAAVDCQPSAAVDCQPDAPLRRGRLAACFPRSMPPPPPTCRTIVDPTGPKQYHVPPPRIVFLPYDEFRDPGRVSTTLQAAVERDVPYAFIVTEVPPSMEITKEDALSLETALTPVTLRPIIEGPMTLVRRLREALRNFATLGNEGPTDVWFVTAGLTPSDLETWLSSGIRGLSVLPKTTAASLPWLHERSRWVRLLAGLSDRLKASHPGFCARLVVQARCQDDILTEAFDGRLRHVTRAQEVVTRMQHRCFMIAANTCMNPASRESMALREYCLSVADGCKRFNLKGMGVDLEKVMALYSSFEAKVGKLDEPALSSTPVRSLPPRWTPTVRFIPTPPAKS